MDIRDKLAKVCRIDAEKNEAICDVGDLDSVLSEPGIENSISSVKLLKTTGKAKLKLRD